MADFLKPDPHGVFWIAHTWGGGGDRFYAPPIIESFQNVVFLSNFIMKCVPHFEHFHQSESKRRCSSFQKKFQVKTNLRYDKSKFKKKNIFLLPKYNSFQP